MGVIRNCQSTETSPILQRPSSRTSMFLSPSETYARAGHVEARRETTVIQGIDNTVSNRNIVHVYIDPNTGRVISNDERFNEEDERLRNAEHQDASGGEEQIVEDEGELENVVATLTRMQQFSDALREFADTITGEEEHSAINELSNLLQHQESPVEAVEVEPPIILVEDAPAFLNRVDHGALQVATSTPFIMSSIASPMNNRSTPTGLVQGTSRPVEAEEDTNENRPPHTSDLQTAIIDVLNRNIEEEISQNLVDRRNETAERWRRLISRRRTMFESMVQQEVQFWHSVEERLACLNVSDAPLIDNFEHVGKVSYLQNSELVTDYVGR
ncbi:hypothetical protein MP638_001999 [Amoeboaphelidium occidentale]|nr:hypothetical protein MP638_001999 [Amoeboaphelidium occidentale]